MDCPTCGKPPLEGTFFECENDHAWWTPNPGPQTRFLETNAHEVLYGGAAGGGKSAALVMAPLRWSNHPHFKGVIIRRETGQLEELIDLARHWYPRVIPGTRMRNDGKALTSLFPIGAKIIFSHCKDEADWENFQGKQYQYIGFDELTHFTETQYLKIKSRIRSAHKGLPRFVRATSNPGGTGHEWVFKRWGAWLNPKFVEENPGCGLKERRDAAGELLPPLRSGEVAWIEKGPSDQYEKYLPCKPAIVDDVKHGSRVFIGAKLTDNRVLMANDPGYARNLADLDAVTRAQHADGNWLIKPAKGLYFKRGWWKLVDAVPADVKLMVRYWDRAGSDDERSDWTAGVRMCRVGDEYWIDDVVHVQETPGGVERTILNTATLDRDLNPRCEQHLELDPGQAGKSEAYQYAKLLAGFRVQFPRPSGDKVTRASTFSSQVEAGNVRVLRGGRWVDKFLSELEGFPEDDHDDMVDGASGAFNSLLRLGGGSSVAKRATSGTAPAQQAETTLG